jgi:ABC-2 type transport system permease protein
MWAVYKKEIRQFFSGLTAYIAMIVFLLVNGLFLFVFPETSVFNFGYATMDKFFELAPWILLLLVPAITMRSLSDEFRTGTFEILQTKPVGSWQIVKGKYLACLVVVAVALIPTVIYVFSLQQLAGDHGIDLGAAAGSYVGLFFLAAVFASIGLCSSSFTDNPVVAFMAAAFFCFVLYNGFGAISLLSALSGGLDYYMEMVGIDFHYHSISRGVIDSRDVVYFLSLIFFFLILTKRNLSARPGRG